MRLADDLSAYLFWNRAHTFSRRGQRSAALGVGAVVTASVFVLSVAVNGPDSWQGDQIRGWLPVLFVPAIALLAAVFGLKAGLAAGVVASGLAIVAAEISGGSLYEGWNTPPGVPADLSWLGFLLPLIFLTAGCFYGSNFVLALERPTWQLVVSGLVFPIVLLILVIWSLGDAWDNAAAPHDFEPPAELLEQAVNVQHLEHGATTEAEAPATAGGAVEVFRDEMAAILERGAVDQPRVDAAIAGVIEEGYDPQQLLLGDLGLEDSEAAAVVDIIDLLMDLIEDYSERKKAPRQGPQPT